MGEYAPLSGARYEVATREIATNLLGALLVRISEGGLCSGIIVETEAYLSQGDPGCHAANGRTPRNEAMFGPPGTAYVYLVYGMYHCLNVVTAPQGTAEAVLIRALEPVDGLEIMAERRGRTDERALCSGPSKLCQALDITRDQNLADLTRPPLYICEPPAGRTPVSVDQITTSTRIGLAPGRGDDLPLRYYLTGSPFISRR